MQWVYKLDVMGATHPTNRNGWRKTVECPASAEMTEHLIEDAEFVMAHTGTALDYAIINIKSGLLIYTEQRKEI